MRTFYKFFLQHSPRYQETMYWYCDDKDFGNPSLNKEEIVAECVQQGYLCSAFASSVKNVMEVNRAEYREHMYEDEDLPQPLLKIPKYEKEHKQEEARQEAPGADQEPKTGDEAPYDDEPAAHEPEHVVGHHVEVIRPDQNQPPADRDVEHPADDVSNQAEGSVDWV